MNPYKIHPFQIVELQSPIGQLLIIWSRFFLWFRSVRYWLKLSRFDYQLIKIDIWILIQYQRKKAIFFFENVSQTWKLIKKIIISVMFCSSFRVTFWQMTTRIGRKTKRICFFWAQNKPLSFINDSVGSRTATAHNLGAAIVSLHGKLRPFATLCCYL